MELALEDGLISLQFMMELQMQPLSHRLSLRFLVQNITNSRIPRTQSSQSFTDYQKLLFH